MTIHFPNNGNLVASIGEIPSSFVGARRIFLDVETGSFDSAKDSLNPWRNCHLIGFGITVDDCSQAYYADYRYTKDFYQNAPQFIQNVLWYAEEWINHNIKYDMHVLHKFGIKFPKSLKCKCTLVRARLKDSDRNAGTRGGYSLDKLSESWCGHDISSYEMALQPYLGKNNKDYSKIPSDRLAEYGCQDVLSNRDIDTYIDSKLPEHCGTVAATEIKVTSELFKLEQQGMLFDENEMRIAQFYALNRLAVLDDELYRLTEMTFKPNVNEDCNSVLCGKYGLPVVKWNTTAAGEENASFDKQVLKAYQAMPFAPHPIIDRIVEYRKLATRNSFFFTPLLEFGWEGHLHPSYGQSDARTGRMICKLPNAQQFDLIIKGLIRPPKGWSIMSTDASQIEKRLVIHYIQDQNAMRAYRENPDTDFYDMLALQCGIKRKPAKTIDLASGYGAGERKVISQLKADPDVMAAVKAKIAEHNITGEENQRAAFERFASELGKSIYKSYHENLPSLKTRAKEAEKAVKSRNLGSVQDNNHCYGYITNLYGRDRHLPYAKYRTNYKEPDALDRAWLAFPTVCQGTAADMLKERFVAATEEIGDAPIHAIGLIHDSVVWIAPTEIAHDPRTARDLVGILESPNVELSIPIRWNLGVSDDNWADADKKVSEGGKAAPVHYNKSECQNFEWLR